MTGNILQWLGMRNRLPSPSGDAAFLHPEVQGDAQVVFRAGQKAAYPEDEATSDGSMTGAEQLDAVAYPGRSAQIIFCNEEQTDGLYRLSITDLPSSYYVRLPAIGGQWQPNQDVLLEPGQETEIGVRFMPVEKDGTSRPFRIIITRFDPRRASSEGVVISEAQNRWVPYPTAADLRLSLAPEVILTRPWRRQPLLQIGVQNGALLPTELQLELVRGATREVLKEAPEPVETLRQALPARVSGQMHCLLPVPGAVRSYLLTLTGTANVPDGGVIPLTTPRPISVRYIPWLWRGRDWAFLAGCLFALLWLAFGIPISRSPLVHIQPDFASDVPGAHPLPPGVTPNDIVVTLIPSYSPETKIFGTWKGNGYDFALPSRLFGWRIPFGWNGKAKEKMTFTLTAAARPEAQEALQKVYRMEAPWRSRDGSDEFVLDGTAAPHFGTWYVPQTATMRQRSMLEVYVTLGSLGSAAGKADRVDITGELDGKQFDKMSVPLQGQAPPIVAHLQIPYPLGKETCSLTLRAVTETPPLTSAPVTLQVSANSGTAAATLSLPQNLSPIPTPEPKPNTTTPDDKKNAKESHGDGPHGGGAHSKGPDVPKPVPHHDIPVPPPAPRVKLSEIFDREAPNSVLLRLKTDPAGPFGTMSKIRISASPGKDGALVILLHESDGSWSLLYPRQSLAHSLLVKGQSEVSTLPENRRVRLGALGMYQLRGWLFDEQKVAIQLLQAFGTSETLTDADLRRYLEQNTVLKSAYTSAILPLEVRSGTDEKGSLRGGNLRRRSGTGFPDNLPPR